MKVFMSWSGHRSHEIAKMFHNWLKCVIQATDPWLSSDAVESGSVWFSSINNELRDASTGIICLTQENKNKPWILFEAGALAKGLTTNHVCTLLIDLQPYDLQDPLAQFNATLPTKEGIKKLVFNINARVEKEPLNAGILAQVFETYWPQFERSFAAILAATEPTEEPERRSEGDILHEILGTTRVLGRRLNRLEENLNTTMHSEAFNYTDAKRATRQRQDTLQFFSKIDPLGNLSRLRDEGMKTGSFTALVEYASTLGLSETDLNEFLIIPPDSKGIPSLQG